MRVPRRRSHNIILYNFWATILVAVGFVREDPAPPPTEEKPSPEAAELDDGGVLLLTQRVAIVVSDEEPLLLENRIDVPSLYPTAEIFESRPSAFADLILPDYKTYEPFSFVPKDSAVSFSPLPLPSYFRQPYTPEDFDDSHFEEPQYDEGRGDINNEKAPGGPNSLVGGQSDEPIGSSGKPDELNMDDPPPPSPPPEADMSKALLAGVENLKRNKEATIPSQQKADIDTYDLESGSILKVEEGRFEQIFNYDFTGGGTIQFLFDLDKEETDRVLAYEKIADSVLLEEEGKVDLRADTQPSSQPSPALPVDFGFMDFSTANLDV